MKKFILAAFLILGLLASGCGGAPTEKKADEKLTVILPNRRGSCFFIQPRHRFLREVARNGRRPRIRRVVQIGVCCLPDGRSRRVVADGSGENVSRISCSF